MDSTINNPTSTGQAGNHPNPDENPFLTPASLKTPRRKGKSSLTTDQKSHSPPFVLSVLSVVKNLLLRTCCPKLAKGIVVRVADLSEPNGRTLLKKEYSTSLAPLAISPAGHIRLAGAKQQTDNMKSMLPRRS